MDAYERGYNELLKLVELMNKAATGQVELNEADTRLQIIDRLLLDVLGWPREAIRAEQHTESGYLDYSVGLLGAQFVLEAKRVGRSFNLPVGLKSRAVPIESITSGANGRELREALLQAGRYAQERGIAAAAAFNGHQLVIFLASRTDGLAPLSGKALIFATPESMRDEFVVLWNNLSPQGMQDRSLHQTLQASLPLPPEPLSFRLQNYPGNQRRNDLQTGLQILSDLFLGDLEDIDGLQESFLRECYASSGALSQYAEVSRQILATRYELLRDVNGAAIQEAVGKKGVTKGFTADIVQAALSNRPVILLGDVGAGKTTFIERLINVDAREVLGESVSIYVDFGASSTMKALAEHVLDACVRQLREEYETNVLGLAFAENVLRDGLRLFDESPSGALKDTDPGSYRAARISFINEQMSDRSNYLRSCFEWIRKSWRRQVVIFLDNIDQRSAADQNQVFLIANELAKNWPATVFVTLRPETFYNSEREGAISGYHPRVFTISPPRADVMIKLRVNFALKQLRSSGRLGTFPHGIAVDSASLELFLEMLHDNFGFNDQLIRLVDNLAGGNMRLALQFVTEFVGSGHINTEKIIEVQRRYGRYTVPIHEFLRSLMFGDHRYYDPDSSHIPNLFRVTQRDPREHFIIPLCLAFVQKAGELDTEHGYVPSRDVFNHMQQFGFDPSQTAEALEYALRFRLIDSTRRYGRKLDDEVCRITTVGAYCYKTLIDRFTYVDAAIVDIPILDESMRARIGDAHTLAERVDRVRLVREYLDNQWLTVGGDPTWSWPIASARLDADLQRVSQFAS